MPQHYNLSLFTEQAAHLGSISALSGCRMHAVRRRAKAVQRSTGVCNPWWVEALPQIFKCHFRAAV